jgi:hypothetical protein
VDVNKFETKDGRKGIDRIASTSSVSEDSFEMFVELSFRVAQAVYLTSSLKRV